MACGAYADERTPLRKRYRPDPETSPKHRKGAPSPRTAPQRVPRLLEASLDAIAEIAEVLHPSAGSNLEKLYPLTRVMKVLGYVPLPNHLRGTLSVIERWANAQTCKCTWRSYEQIAAMCKISTRQAIANVAELEGLGCVHTQARKGSHGGNLLNAFTVQVPQSILDRVAEYRAAVRTLIAPSVVAPAVAGPVVPPVVAPPVGRPVVGRPVVAPPVAAPPVAAPPVAAPPVAAPPVAAPPVAAPPVAAPPVAAPPVAAPPVAAPPVVARPVAPPVVAPPVIAPPVVELPGIALFTQAADRVRARRPAAFDQWFSCVQFDGLVDGLLKLRAQNDFVRDMVEPKLQPALVDELRTATGGAVEVAWSLDTAVAVPIARAPAPIDGASRAAKSPVTISRPTHPIPEAVMAAPRAPLCDRPGVYEGAIVELLAQHQVHDLEEATATLATSLARMARRHQIDLRTLLVGVEDAAIKLDRDGRTFRDFCVSCVRQCAKVGVRSVAPPLRAILKRAEAGDTVGSWSIATQGSSERGPP